MLAVRQLEMRRVCGHNANSTKPFFFIGWLEKTRPFTAAPHREGLRIAGSAFCFPLLCANMLLRRTDISNRGHHRAAHGGRAVPHFTCTLGYAFRKNFSSSRPRVCCFRSSQLFANVLHCNDAASHRTIRSVCQFGERGVFYCICASSPG